MNYEVVFIAVNKQTDGSNVLLQQVMSFDLCHPLPRIGESVLTTFDGRGELRYTVSDIMHIYQIEHRGVAIYLSETSSK